ncbi:hypothetical protein PFISCL1PPCAC_29227, partial [Pristionchus fissidentatus]
TCGMGWVGFILGALLLYHCILLNFLLLHFHGAVEFLVLLLLLLNFLLHHRLLLDDFLRRFMSSSICDRRRLRCAEK